MLEAPATFVCIWGRALKAIRVGPGQITLRLFIPNVSLSIDFSSFSISLLSHWAVLSLLYLHVCPSIYPSPHLQKCTIRYNVFISVTNELCKCPPILDSSSISVLSYPLAYSISGFHHFALTRVRGRRFTVVSAAPSPNKRHDGISRKRRISF